MNKHPDKKMNKEQYSRTRIIAREYLIAVRNDPDELESDEEIFERIGLKLGIETRFVRCIINNRSKVVRVNKSNEKFSVNEIIEIKRRLVEKYGENTKRASKISAVREYSKTHGLYWSESQIRHKRNSINWLISKQ